MSLIGPGASRLMMALQKVRGRLEQNCESAPLLHDGRALGLEEIRTADNPEYTPGATANQMKDQLDDLILCPKTLGRGNRMGRRGIWTGWRLLITLGSCRAVPNLSGEEPVPLYTRWETFTAEDGPPNNEIVQDTQVLFPRSTRAGIAHDFVLAVDLQDNDVWVGTARGLSHGFAP